MTRLARLLPLFVASAALVSASVTIAAHATPAAEPPSVVLVHGAFADGSDWARVIPLLQARGLATSHVPQEVEPTQVAAAILDAVQQAR